MSREKIMDLTQGIIKTVLIMAAIFGAALFMDDRVDSRIKEGLKPATQEIERVRGMESTLARVEAKLEAIEKRLDRLGWRDDKD